MSAKLPSSRLLPVLLVVAAGAAWALAGCAREREEAGMAKARQPAPADPTVPADPGARARELTERLLVVDTHIDLPYRLTEQEPPPDDPGGRTARGDFDAVRAREGGLDVAWMSIYVPAAYQESGGARQFADGLIDMVEGIVAKHPETFILARTADEAAAAARAGKIALPLGIENAAAFEDDVANVRHFYDRGVRYATLTHGADNLIGDASYSEVEKRRWHGLSPFGHEVVAEMNRLGMLVDLAHVSDETFDAALGATVAPPIVSHSSCRHFTPGFERNLDDARIRALAAKGGTIQINFGSSFLTAAANAWGQEAWDAEQKFRAESGAKEGSAALEAFRAEYQQTKPMPRATLDDVADHVLHVVELAGADHVGLGSDFDGVGPTLPAGLEDVSKYPNLTAKLLERGLSEADLEKILGGNLMRAWRAAEQVAGELQAAERR